MEKVYVIFVIAPINGWNVLSGFYSNCYQSSINGEKGTWINFTDKNDEWSKIKQFRTYKAAENKLKFLEKKIEENGYMWNWTVRIEEITKEDLI